MMTSRHTRFAFVRLCVAALGLAACCAAPSARAATLTWFSSGSTGASGGTGTWDTSNARWTADGSTWSVWNNAANDVALFGGATAGTVTLTAPITANGVTFATTGYLITGGTLTLAGSSPTLTANSSVTGTIASIVAGSAGLTKSGAGTILLSSANTYTGTTTISAGTLTAGNASAFGTSSVSIGSAGTLGVNGGYTIANAISVAAGSTIDSSGAGNSNNVIFSGTISGSGGWTLKANGDTSDTGGGVGGSTRLSASNTFTGPITITAGVVDANSNFGGAGTTIILNGGGLVDKNVGVNVVNNIQVGTAGGILRRYANVGTNTYSGTFSNVAGVGFTTLRHTDGATQQLAGSGVGYVGSYYNARGDVVLSAANAAFKRTDFTLDTNSSSVAFTISGGGTATIKSITKPDKDVVINNGTILDVASGNIAWATTGGSWFKTTAGATPGLTSSSGTLTIANGSAFGTQTTGDQQEQIVIRDFDVSTPLTLVKTNQNRLALTAANSYTGGTVINGGRVAFNSGALPATGSITINRDGALDASGANANVSAWLTSGRIATSSSGALIITANTSDAIDFTTGGGYNSLWLASSGAVTHSGSITPGTNGYLFGAANTNTLTVSSNLTAATGLTKKGASGLTLTGTNTYTGPTTIREGTLTLDFSASNAPASNILLSTGTLGLAGGTFQMTGKASTTSSQTFAGTTLASARASSVSSTIGTSGTNNLTLGTITRGAGSTVNFTLPATGAITLTGGATSLVKDATTGGAWATVGTTNWAATDSSSNIVAATYTTFATAGTVTLSGNADLTAGTAGTYTLGAASTPGSVRVTSAGHTIALGGFNLSTSGVLSNQGATISGNGNVQPSAAGGELVFVQTANTLTVSSTINTTGNVTKSGAGTLALTGANTIGGTIYVAQGTLNTGNTNALGNANIVMGPNTTLRQNNSTSLAGSGTITLSDGAMIRQEAANAVGTLSRNIVLNSTNAYASIGGFIFGNGSLTTSVISGTGDVLLGNWDTSNGGIFRTGWRTNSYVGQTYVTGRGGTIQFNFNGATPTNNGTLTPFGANTNPSAILYNSTIQFNGIASTSNNWLIDNAITLDASGNFGSGNITVTFDDGIAHFNKPLTVKQASTNTATLTLAYSNKPVYIDGALGGYGTLRLNSSNQSGRFVITGTNNSFNGVLSVEKSTASPYLELAANGAAQSAVVALGDATSRLYVNTTSATIAGLTGVASSDVASNDGTLRTLTLNVGSNEAYTHEGTIGVNGAALNLVKSGVGTQVLSASNSYTGSTTVSAGTLRLGNASALGTTTAALAVNGGTLDLFGNSVTVGPLSGSAGGTITSGSAAVVTLTTSLAATGTYGGSITNGSGTTALVKAGAGTLSLSGTNSFTGGLTIRSGTVFGANSSALSASGTVTLGDAGTGSGNAALLVDTTVTAASVTLSSPILVSSQGSGSAILGSATGNNFAAFSGAVTLARDVSLVGGNSLRTDFTGGISGTGNVTISGPNRVAFLTTANTYTGTTTINSGGTLQLSDGNTTSASLIPDASVVVNNGTLNFARASTSETIGGLSGSGVVQVFPGLAQSPTLVVSATQTLTFSGTISNGDSGTMSFTKSGAGTQILTGTSTYTGATTITGGTLQIGGGGASGAIAATSAVSGSAGATFAFQRTDAVTYSGTVGGAVNLAQLGSGTLSLTGANTYTGTTSLAAGVLSLGSAGAIGSSGTISFTGGTLQLTASNNTDYSSRFSTASGQSFSIDTNAVSGTLATGLTSTGATLTKLGSGTLTLTADSTFSGATTISAGVLQLGAGGAAGGVAGNIANSGTLVFNRSNALTVGGIISGTGAIVQAGPGVTTLSAPNTYTGITTITSGTLAVSSDGNLGAVPGSPMAGRIVVNGGALSASLTFTLDSRRGIALGPASGSGTGTLDVAGGQTLTYSGTIADNGGGGDGLTKTGAGTLLLSGTSTYSANTTVAAGLLQVTGSLASPNVAVSGGAALGGTGAVNATTVADLGGLTPGTGIAGSGGIGTLSLASLAFDGSGTITIGVQSNTTSSLVNVIGGVTTSGGPGSVAFAFGSSLNSITTGTYTLLSYGGTQLGDVSAFQVTGNSGARQGVNLENGTKTVNLVISNAFPIWTGSTSTVWTGSDNWILSSSGSATSFLPNDTVVFDDTASNGTVTLTGTVNPATTTFSGTTLAYTLSGGFGITTGNLMKSGPATLTISTSNSFSGGTTLSAGTVRIGDEAALGTGDVLVTGTATGITLSSDGGTSRTIANTLQLATDVTLGNASDAGALTFTGTVNLGAGTRTITTPSNVTLSGLVTAGGLTKAGAGTLTITGANNAYSGGTTISSGSLVVTGAAGLGSGAVGVSGGVLAVTGTGSVGSGLVTLSSGTILVGNDTALGALTVTLNGGELASTGTAARTLANALSIGGNVALGDTVNTGALTLGAGGIALGGAVRQITTDSDITFAGAVTGVDGGITKLGAGTLTLSASSSYTGGTTLSSGSIVLGNASALGTGNLTYAAPVTVRTTVGGTIANGIVVNAVSGTFDSGANAVTFSGSVSVAGGGTFTPLSSTTQAITGVVSGSGTLVKGGANALTLSGANTLTGTVSLSAGQLNLNSASALGAGRLLIAGASTLDNTSGTAVTLTGANPQDWNADFTFAGSNPLSMGSGAVTLDANRQVTVTSSTLTVGGAIGGGFALTKAGAGTLALTGASGYSGGTTLSAGTLLVSNATALGTGTVAVNGGTLNVSGVTAANAMVLGGGTLAANGGTLSGVLSGAGGLTVTGAGTLTLTGSNTYSGGTTLSGGTLQIGSGGTTGSISGPIANNAALVFTRSDSLTFGGTISGNGTLTKLGAGTLTLTAANTLVGTTTITSGTLEIGAGGNLAGPVANAATFQLNRSDSFTYAGVISGSGAVRQVGVGTTTLSGSNTFSGVLTIAQGGVAISTINNVSANGPLGNSASAVVLGSSGALGTLFYTGATASSSKPFTLATGGTGGFDVGVGTTLTASGLIDGAGGLVKTGAGTLKITTVGTYTGTTVINGGTLELNTTSYTRGLATAAMTVNSGATFLINGMNILYTGASFIPITANSGTIQIGGASGNHNHFGSLTLNGGVIYGSNPAPYTSQYSTFDATVTVGGSARSVISGASTAYGYSLVNTGRIFDVAATGDPSGVDLLVSAPFLADGTTGVIKSGAGVMSMTGTNTYSGNTVINAGTYKVSGGGKLYAGTYNDTAVITVNAGGTLELDSYAYDAAGSTGQLSAYSARRVLTGGTINIVGSSQSSGNDFQVSNGSTGAFTMTQAGQTLTLTDNPNDNIKIGGRLTFGGAGNITVNEVVQDNTGAGSIVKAGLGTLTFGAAMTYTGSTTINSGTFILAGAGQLGGGSYGGAFTNNAAFVSSASANQTFSGVVSGSGSFTKSGAGTLTLSNGANSITGGVSLSAGVLSFVSGGLGSSGTVSLGGGTLQWAAGNTSDLSSRLALVNSTTTTLDVGSNNVTLANGIGGGSTAALVKAGSGALALSSSNGFSGGLAVSAGSVLVGNDAALGTGAVSLANGVALSSADTSARAIANAIAVNGDVTLGDATNTGALTFTGGMSLGAATRTLTTPSNITIASAVTGAGGLTKAGAGSLTLSASNSYAGDTTINAGTLALSGGGDISAASAALVSIAPGAALDISAASGLRTIGELSGGDATSQVNLGGNTLRSVVTSLAGSFGGVISGSGGFTKAGGGTLNMESGQAFTGPATVEAGTLLVAGTGLASAERIYVASGASIESTSGPLTIVDSQTLGGYGTVYGDLAFVSGGILSPGGSVGTLTGTSGNTTFNGGMRYLFEVNNASGTPGIDPGWDLFSTTGDLTLNITGTDQIFVDLTSLSGTSPGQAANFDPTFNYAWKFVVAGSEIGYQYALNPTWFQVTTGAFQNTAPGNFYVARGDQLSAVDISGGTSNELYVVYAAIPEPSTLALAGIGLAAAGWAASRRRRRAT